MSLAETSVLIVDCQTTGASPELGEVLEIGWCRVTAGGPGEGVIGAESHLVALPEGKAIPRVVSRLTGIDARSMEGALPAEEVWRGLSGAALGLSVSGAVPRAPAVIHFARFEVAFLRDWHHRFGGGAELPLDVVCAHEIARRLYPDLPRAGLRALAGFLGHGVELTRRSAGHVEATAFVWRKVVAELAGRGIGTFEELKGWLREGAPARRGKRVFPVARDKRLSLPDAPGVYRFSRANGDVLYVGKATSLKARVNSHFTSGRAAGERSLEMLTQVSDIQFTVTGSAVEAAMLESDTIKALEPPYNVQLRGGERGVWFATPDLARVTARPEGDRAIGPLPSRYAVSALAALRGLLARGGALGEGGAAASEEERARCLGIPPVFAPDEGSFAAGWREFAARHLAPVRSRTRWGALLRASKTLFRLLGEGALDEEEAESGEGAEARPGAWDPAHVRRGLERAVALGGRLLRRARWLCLLSESVVGWRQSGDDVGRVLWLRAGWTDAGGESGGGPAPLDLLKISGGAAGAPDWHLPWRERQACFDAARYDRLRVLTTELKRIRKEGGEVVIRVGERRELRGERLDGLLGWV